MLMRTLVTVYEASRTPVVVVVETEVTVGSIAVLVASGVETEIEVEVDATLVGTTCVEVTTTVDTCRKLVQKLWSARSRRMMALAAGTSRRGAAVACSAEETKSAARRDRRAMFVESTQ